MHESSADLDALQRLLDASFAASGPHLRNVITPSRRPDAGEIVELLTGMRLLVLATVTADARPIGGPVDGIFFRGAWHFGSFPRSLRFKHIGKRPQVTATHLPGEEFAVTVHGTAEILDLGASEHTRLRQTLLDIYIPQHRLEWERFLDSEARYARIDAAKMFVFRMR